MTPRTGSMTKKHFEALAAALAKSVNRQDDADSLRLQWVADVETIADVCARFNPNFDRARFLAACGVEEGK